jgi:dipeptidyl aminopeptidase/acylaminoacyl peptidase
MWSPDGHWISFLSDRPLAPEKEEEPEPKPKEEKPQIVQPKGRDDDEKEKEPVTHVYLLSAMGGEAFPVTRGEEEVHAYAWAPNSSALYFATRTPWSKAKRDAYKREWKDVLRYRESERGDVIASIKVGDALARRAAVGGEQAKKPEVKTKQEETAETPGAVTIAPVPERVRELAASPNGNKLAVVTDSRSQRVEGVESYEIYVVEAAGGQPRRLTNNQAMEEDLRWSPDGQKIFFVVNLGSVEGAYKDLQTRLYSVGAEDGKAERWAANFPGAIDSYDLAADGSVVATARKGTEVQLYSQKSANANFAAVSGPQGTRAHVSVAQHSPRMAFIYSSLEKPEEVYLAESLSASSSARPITALNAVLAQRELPRGVPYKWKADDGSHVEGMLIYPPGKFGAKHLRTFTLIHGGPADADGNQFGADWYDWGILAASNDWLVFRPNYRGSSGYGDRFMTEIVPQIVSRPGKDILEGIDALVKEGIADPERLAIGGYSYGGYMTNWLITQTPRFKAALSGAGAVEHAANWGNDDLSFDDAYFLGGTPWEAQKRYNEEAALWQINKVKTPTHVVAGEDDIRVSVAENYLLERALHALRVPSTLLIFPGEGHSLKKNPWHGKIKVREELKWLEKYVPASPSGRVQAAQ